MCYRDGAVASYATKITFSLYLVDFRMFSSGGGNDDDDCDNDGDDILLLLLPLFLLVL